MPATLPLAEMEQERVATAFAAMRAGWPECGCCLDAEVDLHISASSLFGAKQGGLPGYLQVVSDAGARFVGVNPLGQPLVILALAGERLFLVLPADARFYEGSIKADEVSRYLPLASLGGPGAEWLFGRLPTEGFRMTAISRDRETEDYWVELAWQRSDYTSRVLFDAAAGLIRRHQVFKGATLLTDLNFTEFRFPDRDGTAKKCMMPGRITAFFKAHEVRAELRFDSMVAGEEIEARSFVIERPSGYEYRRIR